MELINPIALVAYHQHYPFYTNKICCYFQLMFLLSCVTDFRFSKIAYKNDNMWIVIKSYMDLHEVLFTYTTTLKQQIEEILVQQLKFFLFQCQDICPITTVYTFTDRFFKTKYLCHLKAL